MGSVSICNECADRIWVVWSFPHPPTRDRILRAKGKIGMSLSTTATINIFNRQNNLMTYRMFFMNLPPLGSVYQTCLVYPLFSLLLRDSDITVRVREVV